MSAAPPNAAQFVTQFPAFADVDPGSITNALAWWTAWFSASAWGQNFGDAVAYASAHSLALAQIENVSPNQAMTAGAGNITSSSGPGLSIAFAPPPFEAKGAAESYWMKTSYGQWFLTMRHNVIAPGVLSA